MTEKSGKQSTSEGQVELKHETGVTPKVTNSTAVIEPTKDELMEQLKTAMASNDWKAVTKVSSAIDKLQKSIDRSEREAKESAVTALCGVVKSVIDEALSPFINDGTLDSADGIWYSYDFGDGSSSIRLLSKPGKGTTTKSSEGVGKKYAVTKDKLMEICGGDQYKDSGMTCAEFFESTTDGNKRYQLRMFMLKKAGYTKE